jgi:Spy/CpxP family protein refolding chaperone
MIRSFLLSILLSAAVTLGMAPLVAYAQQSPRGGQYDDMTEFDNQPGRGPALSEQKREEIRNKIETVRIWRLTEQLKLDTATSAKLASLLGPLDQQRQGVMQEQAAGMRELRLLLKSQKPDQTKIKSSLERIVKNQNLLQGLREQEWKGLQEILTVEQQARFLLFQQEFRREMQNMIVNARMGNRRSPSGGRGRGPGMESGGPMQSPEN